MVREESYNQYISYIIGFRYKILQIAAKKKRRQR